MIRVARLVIAAAVLASCGDREVPAWELGAEQFRSPRLSTSPFNAYSCATCHAIARPGDNPARSEGRLDPGFNLHGVVHRPTFWGGDKLLLLDAINFCVTSFMGGAALAADDERARQVYEYLVKNSPEAPSPALPMTIVKNVTPLSELAGDARRGGSLYGRSCARCHGAPTTGKGRLDARAIPLPEPVISAFPTNARHVFVEKVRHGRFFHLAGIMPPYPLEALSDDELADILAYLGL